MPAARVAPGNGRPRALRPVPGIAGSVAWPVVSLEAVLFDMDGTLLDSERVWDIALEDLAQYLGGSLTPPVRQSMVGSSLWRSVAIVHEALGVDVDVAESAEYLTTRTAALFRTHLTWKPGARELLEAVAREGLPAALVTSTHRGLTEIALDFMGRRWFAATVCGDEVNHPKPAPDPYLRAAELLEVDPAGCVAIEDSPLGLASAEAAGCAVLAVPSEVPLDAEPGRTVVASLRDVDLAFLRKLI
jgi:HAD superfamily hydrolase (TIGR01509 family)